MNERNALRQDMAGRLRLARDMAGLSQGQVARQLGWHRPTVSEIEAGRRRVQTEELTVLAELYGVRVPWIIGVDNDEAVSDRVTLAARELGKLNDEDLERLLRLIRSLKTFADAK